MRLSCVLFGLIVASSVLCGSEPEVDYMRDIKPLFLSKCYACHSVLKQEAGLRLDSRQWMQVGGDSGSILDQAGAVLLERITAEDDSRMPPPHEGTALRTDEIDTITRWLKSGAPAPEEPTVLSPLEHWAFQPIDMAHSIHQWSELLTTDPIRQSGFSHPVDVLLEQTRLAQGLEASPPIDRNLLLRRLYLDLIGLLPTPEQLIDDREIDQIADELLSSPLYGQRWGRHWMDIWRYSDWYGLGEQLRNSQKHLWHWRDWIVDSLNEDKGYDRMIMEMLAGDELEPDNLQVVAGTGFLARNYYLFNRTTWLDDTLEHTAKAFLGLTINCAKCHDHKYDPISQVDYYNFRAIFEPHQVRLDPLGGTTDLEVDGLPRAFDDNVNAPTYLHRRGDANQPDKQISITAGIPAVFTGNQPPIHPIQLPLSAYAPGTRDDVRHQLLTECKKDIQAIQAKIDDAAEGVPSSSSNALTQAQMLAAECKLRSLQATIVADDVHFGMVDGYPVKTARDALVAQSDFELAQAKVELLQAGENKEARTKAEEKVLQIQAKLSELHSPDTLEAAGTSKNFNYTRLKVSRKALETPAHQEADYPAAYSPISSGRRLALAQWIASKQNPLTARVAVNHIWMRHFGEPLVENVFDFGLRTSKPTQHALLDYLAAEFMQSGWSMKHLHRLLVTSQAYGMGDLSIDKFESAQQADSANRYWWRSSVRRMEAQVVRDCLLEMAGVLDQSLAGPPVDVGPSSRRRSLYFRHSPDDQDQFLAMFDNADLLQCYRRTESIVPQQALALSNSQLALEMSDLIARRIIDSVEVSSPDEGIERTFIERAFLTILARSPTTQELELCEAFCENLRVLLSDVGETDAMLQRVRGRLVHSLLNHNDFISIR